MKANKENLIKCLEQIGWSVKSYSVDEVFVYNHRGNDTHWRISIDKVYLDDFAGDFFETPTCCFYFKSCKLNWLGSGSTICLTAKGSGNSVFVYFGNNDMNKNNKTVHKGKKT